MKANRSAERVRAARVDEDNGDDYVPPRGFGRSRHRRQPLRKLLILLAIFAAIVAALPTIVAKTPLRNTLLSYALPDDALRVTVDDASLGWLSPPAIMGVTVRDAAGNQLATVESIRMNRSPLALASNWHELGEIEVQRPVVYLAIRPGGTNWQDALAPFLADAKSNAAADTTQSESAIPTVAFRVVDGTVLVEETATAQRWRLFALNAQLDTHGAADGLPACSIAGQLDTGSTAGPANAPASFAAALTNDQGRQQLTLATAEHPARSRRAVAADGDAGRGAEWRIDWTRNRLMGGERDQSSQPMLDFRLAHARIRRLYGL